MSALAAHSVGLFRDAGLRYAQSREKILLKVLDPSEERLSGVKVKEVDKASDGVRRNTVERRSAHLVPRFNAREPFKRSCTHVKEILVLSCDGVGEAVPEQSVRVATSR